MNALGTTIDPSIIAAIDWLQVAYLDALDHRDMPAWLACFTVDGSYTCINAENDEVGLPVALMLDDSHERLRDRVKFITEVWAGTFEDYRTRHFVQRLRCSRTEDGLFAVTSSVMVLYTTPTGQSEVLVAGRYEDLVAPAAGTAAFKSKRAILDTDVTPRYLVYPV